MLKALAEGETDPAALASLADHRLRASQEQLQDALGACQHLHGVYRRLLTMALEELHMIERQMEQLDQEISGLLKPHEDAIQRLAEVPGLGVDSAHQIIAEIGPAAAVFPSGGGLASWVGVCPGEEESASVSKSTRSPKGNRNMRRLLNQAAHAAVKMKGRLFQLVLKRLQPRLGYKSAIWAIAHRLCRLIRLLLHRQIRYQETGPEISMKSLRARKTRMIKELKRLVYSVDPLIGPVANPA